jgi:hypothetical protein
MVARNERDTCAAAKTLELSACLQYHQQRGGNYPSYEQDLSVHDFKRHVVFLPDDDLVEDVALWPLLLVHERQ